MDTAGEGLKVFVGDKNGLFENSRLDIRRCNLSIMYLNTYIETNELLKKFPLVSDLKVLQKWNK